MTDSSTSNATAGIALARQGPEGLEVFVSRRPPDRGFLPGFRGFVVGGTEETDDEVPLTPDGPYRAPSRAAWGCAARELFEETGLLPLAAGWIRSWADECAVPAPTGDWEQFRAHVRADEIDFAAALRQASRTVDTRVFHPVGHWTTPEWADLQTTTEFFVAEVPAEIADGVEAHLEPDEHRDPVWRAPGRVVDRWRAGEWFLSTPIRLVFEGLAETETVADRDLLGDAEGPSPRTEMIEILGGLRMLPLATPTIPPATHTNSYIVGDGELVLVDPGSGIARELDLLLETLEALADDGHRLRSIVLTHHHQDHVDGVSAVVDRFDADLLAHPATADRLPGGLSVDRTLADEESLEVGTSGGRRLTVYHTPGHAPGHLCLYDRVSRCLIAGDLVASKGTILIDPPEGHMGRYLASLERMRELECRAMLPAHGTVVPDPDPLLTDYLEHRRERETKVLEALRAADGPAAPRDLVEEVYDDAPTSVWPLAVRSLEAHLIHLVERSLAETVDEGYVSSSSST